jgi:FKBP-type peptidyl-prolyl cis-trans isomerase
MTFRRLVLIAVLVASAAAPARADVKVESDDDKALYLIGLTFARQLARLYLSEREAEIVAKAMVDAHKGVAMEVDPEIYGPKVALLQEVRAKKGLEIETKKSASYLEGQRKQKGAKETQSGLIFTDVESGKGPQPDKSSTVKVHYTGRLVDGTIFDSSEMRGQPAEFPLAGVIPCWTEGVSMMKVGGRAKLVCPSGIAYGDRGMPPAISPGAAFTFDVQLISIVE